MAALGPTENFDVLNYSSQDSHAMRHWFYFAVKQYREGVLEWVVIDQQGFQTYGLSLLGSLSAMITLKNKNFDEIIAFLNKFHQSLVQMFKCCKWRHCNFHSIDSPSVSTKNILECFMCCVIHYGYFPQKTIICFSIKLNFIIVMIQGRVLAKEIA